MKRLFYFISACTLLAFASCNKSYDANNEDPAYGTKTIEYSITANAPGYDVSGTKADLGAVARVYWNTANSDMVGVYADGATYLGYLTASNTTTDGGRTTFSGVITRPQVNCTLVFVYATGIIGAEPSQSPEQGTYQSLLTTDGIQYDMSQQSVTGMNVPFCAYATAPYSFEDTEGKIEVTQSSTDFKLATSYNVANLPNSSSTATISKAEITHIASSVSLSCDGTNVSVESGESTSNITIEYTNASPKMIAFATPKSAAAIGVQRHIIINGGMASEFTNNALSENKFYSAGYSSFTGLFSVSSSKKVIFSPGNLQAEINSFGEPTAWKFAAHQDDYIGSTVANTSIGTTAGTIDLFGWSTNGGNDPKPAKYKPWGINLSDVDSDYAGEFVDWGTNEGLKSALGEGWFTLSDAEWQYLLGFSTDDKRGKGVAGYMYFAKANVNGVKGLLIFPDGYIGTTTGNGIATANDKSAGYPTASIPPTTWSSMETAGCVFLPAAGYRYRSNVLNVGSNGYYWSSTPNGGPNAYVLSFYGGDASVKSDFRSFGYSVRLVRESSN